MNKRTNSQIDDENPEWTDEDFARARPASEVLPEILGPAVAAEFLRPRGRPKLAQTKEPVKLRLDPDILEAFRSQGNGWQTQMNAALREWAQLHGLLATNLNSLLLLAQAFEAGDIGRIQTALSDVAKARGRTEVAEGHRDEIAAVVNVLSALDIHLTVAPSSSRTPEHA
jgi:uncharacterized protein (DUF4415 family)